jgi:hypothetical protein
MMHKDGLPNRELLHTLSDFRNDANGFMSGIERCAGPHVPLHHIAGTQSARPHLYQQFAGAYFGDRRFNDAYILVAMVFDS